MEGMKVILYQALEWLIHTFFVDSGANIVVGHHTHCYSGYEEYNKGLIFYSLGNFLFDWKNLRRYGLEFRICCKFLFY